MSVVIRSNVIKIRAFKHTLPHENMIQIAKDKTVRNCTVIYFVKRITGGGWAIVQIISH